MISMQRNSCDKRIGIATPVGVVAMLFLLIVGWILVSCSRERREWVDIVFNKETTPTMRATGVLTFISDSGITRYKMETAEWLFFDEASEPYWYFPSRIHVEKFDTVFRVEASIDADTAYYYTKKKLWKLVSNVEVSNLSGERFESPLLYWDQTRERIYSDEFIRITKGDFVNTGIGFESNQTLTRYEIFHAGAEIPIQDAPVDSTATNESEIVVN